MVARVLIADDSFPVRLLLRQVLASRGHAVTEAIDGDRALALLLAHRPDVAILDVDMPGLDGFALCRAIRGDAGLRTLPIIILSGSAGGGEALAAGADRFVAKPFLPSLLLAVLDELLAPAPGARPVREAAE
jgi:CheY-like chemotaxis protein